MLAALGLRTVDEAVGPHRPAAPARDGQRRGGRLDLDRCSCARRRPDALRREPVRHEGDPSARSRRAGRAAISGARLVEPAYEITNGDRADRRAARRRARARGGGRAAAGRVRARFEGAAGQSFGAFLTAGVELARRRGERLRRQGDVRRSDRGRGRRPATRASPCLVGNTVPLRRHRRRALLRRLGGRALRGAKLGRRRGRRGVGDHACEYMTCGTVVVLGQRRPRPWRGHERRRGVPPRRGRAARQRRARGARCWSSAGTPSASRAAQRYERATGSPRARDPARGLGGDGLALRRLVPRALLLEAERRTKNVLPHSL